MLTFYSKKDFIEKYLNLEYIDIEKIVFSLAENVLRFITIILQILNI